MWYCSAACQRAAWGAHKPLCKAVPVEAMPHVVARPREEGLLLPEVQEAMRASAGAVEELKKTGVCACVPGVGACMYVCVRVYVCVCVGGGPSDSSRWRA